MSVDRSLAARVPAEVRVELAASQNDLLGQLRTIVIAVGAPGGSAHGWIEERLLFLVAPQFRGRGLGQRFYSFACINLDAPRPCFMFPRDMIEEYAGALRGLAIETANDRDFFAIHPSSAVRAA